MYQGNGNHPPLDMRYLVEVSVSKNTIKIRSQLDRNNLSNFDFEISDDLKNWLFAHVGYPHQKWVVLTPFGSELKFWFREEADAILFKLTWC